MTRVLDFIRHSQRSAVLLALSVAALWAPGFGQFRGIAILTLVGSAVWILTNKPEEPRLDPSLKLSPQQSPAAATAQPDSSSPQQPLEGAPTPQTPETAAKIEYDRLSKFFDQLVRYSLLAIGTVLAIAGAFLWKSTNDVKIEADAAIQRTEKSTTAQIADIGKAAQDTVQAQVTKAAGDALDKVQQTINKAAQERVDAAFNAAAQQRANAAVQQEVEAAVATAEKNLAQRLQNFENEINEIGTAASLATLGKIETGNRGAGDSFHQLIEMQYSPNPAVREYVKRSLREIARWCEESANPTKTADLTKTRLNEDRPRDMIAKVKRYPDAAHPYDLWRAFHDMRVLTGWNVEAFDSRAAVKWCADHKPKCEE